MSIGRESILLVVHDTAIVIRSKCVRLAVLFPVEVPLSASLNVFP
jgi:hypothetical protein